ncbi:MULTISPECIES: DUF2194 domain-containing protein [Paenibacillus]|uniref:DUF2194 domain-containing protein n=1 Tax=Paenibacillus TaxID=44249 RepID=UPI0022B8B36F|nr:DUF2194 domain-containing protein [Paenibacillus caseinilyticus]MCZ8518247.1 DUF2194 domain-containing protein [Paenibacillus caseinilyticus]
MPDSKVRLKRSVYLILAFILLLALALQVAQSPYMLQFTQNGKVSAQIMQPAALPETGPLGTPELPYCIAFDSEDGQSTKVRAQLEHVLQSMKKPWKSQDAHAAQFQPQGCSAALVTTSDLTLLADVDTLASYVEGGGSVFFTSMPEESDVFFRLYRKLGIVNTGETAEVQGIVLTSNVLIGEQGLSIDDEFMRNPARALELDGKSRILAESAEGVPLLWEHPYGKGKFMVFNGLMLQEKINRGLLTGSLSLLQPDFIYPVFNSKVMYLDDFPAPIPKGTNPGIYEKYRRDIPSFMKEIWWPDILKAARMYDTKLTAVLIQSYNDRVTAPFRSPVDEDGKGLISFGREVIKSGGELGLHGFNHQSLQRSPEIAAEYGYKPWNTTGDMSASIEEALRFAGTAFPKYTMHTYVPPSNVLSPEGRAALKSAWPDLAVIASLYGEDASGKAYVQEYEIAEDGVLEMPRVTSGYFPRAFDRWAEANAVTSLGIFSHFIHPDDLLDAERSDNLTWDQLYERFTEMLARVKMTHPWLRSMTASEAAVDMKNVLTSRVGWTRGAEGLSGTIAPFRQEAYFILRTERTIGKLSGCEVRRIDEDTYLVNAQAADFHIEWGN